MDDSPWLSPRPCRVQVHWASKGGTCRLPKFVVAWLDTHCNSRSLAVVAVEQRPRLSLDFRCLFDFSQTLNLLEVAGSLCKHIVQTDTIRIDFGERAIVH